VTPQLTGPPRLLLVDDAPEIALIVQRLARRAGQELTTCPDVASAWEYLADGRPDLVILDLNLPGTSGLELCRRIRGSPDLAQLPVALFSQGDRPEDLAAGLEAGVDFVLSKELLCQPEQWQARLEEVLAPVCGRLFRRCMQRLPGRQFPMPAPEGIEALNRALRYQASRQLGPEVVRILVQRAQEAAGPSFEPRWLEPDGLGLSAQELAREDRPLPIVRFGLTTAEQLWCVAGNGISAAFCAVLLETFPPLAELLGQQ
jgi:CheY-like chemotaxis protein